MKKLLCLCAALIACGGTTDSLNDGARTNIPVNGTSSSGSIGDDASTTDPGDSGTTPTADGGGGTPDGGAPDGSIPTDAGGVANAFTGAGAFTAVTGKSSIKGQNDHPFPGGNPASQNCLTGNCHGQGGGGPRFLAGGTVFADVAGTMPLSQAEVRFRDAAGNVVLTNSDVNGNFFITAGQGQNLQFPVMTGARTAAATRLMSGAIANGACSVAACHGAGGVGPIHVP